MFNKHKKQSSAEERPIDRLVDEFVPRWKRTIVYMKKTQVKTWQGAIILAFVAGLAAAAIWIARFDAGVFSEAIGNSATLSLTSSGGNSATVTAGADFSVNVVLNTNSSNVVAVNAIVQYDTADFQLVGAPNISNSIFNNATNNACVSQARAQSAECNIVDTATAGKISIVMAKPTPGVNTTAGQIATLTFKALRPVVTNATGIKINFAAQGNYTDSDVIFDDGNGTDILQSVSPFTVTVNAPTCTSFTYSDWNSCQTDGSQTRTIATSTPTNCAGGNPTLTQSCTYTPPTCTTFTYSDWSSCQSDGKQTRTIATSAPSGCAGGNPALTQSCVYVTPPTTITCTSFTYNKWGACVSGVKTRTVKISSPTGCSGGTPVLSQSCSSRARK